MISQYKHNLKTENRILVRYKNIDDFTKYVLYKISKNKEGSIIDGLLMSLIDPSNLKFLRQYFMINGKPDKKKINFRLMNNQLPEKWEPVYVYIKHSNYLLI